VRALIKNSAVARALIIVLIGASSVFSVSTSVAARTRIDERGVSAAARTRFDGRWSVSIVTEQGSCDRGIRYPVEIVDGAVRHVAGDGNQSIIIDGRVTPRGYIRVNVRSGDQFAEGAGRLSSSAGEGRWQSPTGGCSGYWTAERRGQDDQYQY
jgi:hypothetical protein